MRVLYRQLDPLSTKIAPNGRKNTNEFRGAARGVAKSRTFRTFPPIFPNFPCTAETKQILRYFAQPRKKGLTCVAFARILAQGFVGFLLRVGTGAGDLLGLI